MRTLIPTIILTATLLGACAGPTIWTKPGVTQAEWAQDRYACERDTRMSAASFGGGVAQGYFAQKFFDKCLDAKGYYPVAKE